MKKPKSMDYMEYERSMGMNRTPDKQEQLAKKVKRLESERQEMIKILKEVNHSLNECRLDNGGVVIGGVLSNKIKQALRNAG